MFRDIGNVRFGAKAAGRIAPRILHLVSNFIVPHRRIAEIRVARVSNYFCLRSVLKLFAARGVCVKIFVRPHKALAA